MIRSLVHVLAACAFLFSLTTIVPAQQKSAGNPPEEKQTGQKEKGEKESGEKTAPRKDVVEDPALPAGEGHDLVLAACSQCHAIGVVTPHRESEDRWKQYVDDMIVRGSSLTPVEAKTVLAYLAKNFGPPSPAAENMSAKTAEGTLAEGDGKDLVEARCSVCHDTERLTRVYRDEQGWADLVNTMVSRGAVITPDEVRAITAYLFEHYGIH